MEVEVPRGFRVTLLYLVGDPDIMIRFLDLRISTELVCRHCWGFRIHGVVRVGTTLAAFESLGPSLNSGLGEERLFYEFLKGNTFSGMPKYELVVVRFYT